MTPGCLVAPGVFCFSGWSIKFWAADWRYFENSIDRVIWSRRHARSLWVAGRGAGSNGRNISVWHVAGESYGMFFSGIDRAVYVKSHGDFAGLARGDCRGVLWRLHDFFQLWVGNGQDDGSRRVGARFRLYRRQRNRRIVTVGGRYSVG